MKHTYVWILIVGLIIGGASPTKAVTVYLKDGTQLEVDRVIRIGNSVCLYLDISKIDMTRTVIEDLADEVKIPQEGLAVINVDFSPSDDNTEIIGTGEVANYSQYPVQDVRVTAILMDKNDKVLLRVNGYVHPEMLSPGQTGKYRFRVKTPKGFWKASVEVRGDAVQQLE